MLPTDLDHLISVGSPALSPDGRTVAFVVTRVDPDANEYRSQIWLTPVDGETPPVVEAADLVLTTAVPGPAEEASGLERLAKRYGQLIAVDLLCTAVASRFERRGEPVTETTGEQDA